MRQVRARNKKKRSEVVHDSDAQPGVLVRLARSLKNFSLHKHSTRQSPRFVPRASSIIGQDSFGPAAECRIWEPTCEPCSTFIRNLLSRPVGHSCSLKFPDPVNHSSECVLSRLIFTLRDFKSQPRSLSLNEHFEPESCASFRVSGDRSTNFHFVAARNEKACAEMPLMVPGGKGRYPAKNSDSEQLFDQITEWFKTCISEHRSCIRERSTLPTRLLRTGADMDSSSDKVWLSKTRDLSDRTKDIHYLALSYCWGGTVNMRSLKENIHHREQHGLFIADLPAVIRDAITVTRRLKFEYLWVDSLCICQDDEQEWEKEATLMADIYGGSVFTISALSSPSADIGFLGPRQRSNASIGSIEFSGKGVEHHDGDRPLLLFVRENPQWLDHELTNGSLSGRGWPLQERILAPGVLHFGRDQVFWECNEDHSMSETGDSIYDSLRLIDNTMVYNHYESLWESLICDFMRRDLSVFSDRLHAVSGLAARLRKIGAFTGRYVAGLWESRLDVLLLWTTSRETLPTTVPVKKNIQISTWSWAHVDRRSDPFRWSELKSTLLAPAKFKFEDDTQDMQSMCPGAVVPSCQVVLHGFLQEMNKAIMPNLNEFFGGHRLFGASRIDLDDNIDGLSSYYSIRMLDNAAAISDWLSERYHIEYLVLEQADPDDLAKAEGRSVYKRIGRLSLRIETDDDSMKPYPITPNSNTRYQDIFLDEETPLLGNGQWREIILI